jgi:hypothetical protein
MRILLRFGFCAVVAAIPGAAAHDKGTTVETLSGACTKLTVMDDATDPALCSGSLLNLKLPSGQREFTFVVGQPGSPKSAIMSFFGPRSRRVHHESGGSTFPIYRVYVTSNGGTVDLVAVGSCVLSAHDRITPAKVSCAANTIRGNFAFEFVSDGVPPAASALR